MITSVNDFKNVFFIGVAGTGMSAIAQYLAAVPDMEIDRMVDYIARTQAVRDVVISGGDPLTCSTPKLESILAKLRAVPHLEIIRIGTRIPVSLPQRVDAELCDMLQKYHPLWVNVHFNHPRECTPEAARACDLLSRAGIPLNNQAVLLKGVNDSVETMKGLTHGLMKMRVRPYYVYHCDPVRGSEHMRTTIAKGLEIMEGLRGHTSGLENAMDFGDLVKQVRQSRPALKIRSMAT